MPAAKDDPDIRDYPVRAPFRRKNDLGKSVNYHPDGTDGWPGAKAVFTGVPGSDEVLELQAGVVVDVAEGTHGPPLIGTAIEPEVEAAPADNKPARRTTARRTTTKES